MMIGIRNMEPALCPRAIIWKLRTIAFQSCQLPTPHGFHNAKKPLSPTQARAIIHSLVETGEGRVFTICKHHWLFGCPASSE